MVGIFFLSIFISTHSSILFNLFASRFAFYSSQFAGLKLTIVRAFALSGEYPVRCGQ
jgi:hypothetical protein